MNNLEIYIPILYRKFKYTDVIINLIVTRDNRVIRGSEALRNRMCDLNKYIIIEYL